VKNYGNAVTPALRPYIDGTTSNGQPWHVDGAQPVSSTIQPGQTQTFTLSMSLSGAGTWTASAISLWDNDRGAFWKALPANGQSQQVSFTVAATACAPRPAIEVKAVSSGDGRLAVTVTVGGSEIGNRLHGLRFLADSRTPNTNALIDVPGVGTGLRADTPIPLPGNPISFTFYLRRQTPGQPVTVPVEITDDCGAWQTIVGGGASAPF